MPYLAGTWIAADRLDDARDELHEIRKERAAWVQVEVVGLCVLRYCGACSLEQDDAEAIVASPGTVCDGCGKRAP